MDWTKNQPLGEAYTCLQGEGKYMGVPHILLRVTGCRLRCQFADSFCDSGRKSVISTPFSLRNLVSSYVIFP